MRDLGAWGSTPVMKLRLLAWPRLLEPERHRTPTAAADLVPLRRPRRSPCSRTHNGAVSARRPSAETRGATSTDLPRVAEPQEDPQVERVVGRLICAIRGGDRGLDIVRGASRGSPSRLPTSRRCHSMARAALRPFRTSTRAISVTAISSRRWGRSRSRIRRRSRT